MIVKKLKVNLYFTKREVKFKNDNITIEHILLCKIFLIITYQTTIYLLIKQKTITFVLKYYHTFSFHLLKEK